MQILKDRNDNPFDSRREYYLAYAYFNLNQIDSAERYISEAYQLKPLHYPYSKFYANILEKKGKDQEAATMLNNYLAKEKNQPEAWKYTAAIHAKLGDMEKAAQLVDSASVYFPSDSSILELKKYYTYNSLIPNYDEAVEFYKKRNYAEAIKYFELSESDFQKYGDKVELPNFYNSWAFSLLETNQVSEARQIFERVAKEFPQNYFALKNLGFISFQHEKKYSEAVDYYTRSLAADSPDFFQSYMNLGTAYLVQGQKELAISAYENSLKYGKSEMVYRNLYLLMKEKGDQKKMDYYGSLMQAN